MRLTFLTITFAINIAKNYSYVFSLRRFPQKFPLKFDDAVD